MMFSGEVELGKFLGNIDIIPDAYQAILKTTETYKLQTTPSGIKVLAFNSPTYDYTSRFLEREFGLVSSENHKVVDFISTKVNPKFSINQVAVDLFEHLQNDLKEIKKKHRNMPLVVTGQGLGGYRAILFTLWLLNDIIVEKPKGSSKKTKLPICITFGSPLIGDKALQHAISERPQWKSRFLNVVTKKDPVASFFTSSTPYKPFGTFLFCTDSGGHTTFEDHEAILAVLDAMALSVDGYKGMHDEDNELMPQKEGANLRKRWLLSGNNYRRMIEPLDVTSAKFR